ncbi:MAG TPA: S49 family peptidase, partial [Acetobacteraceae bacterium]|nr:S49 family peptidase [Acetobacteraceae bacterium]
MSHDRFPHLAQRLFNVPLAIRPEKAEIIVAALADRLGVTRLRRGDGSLMALAPMLAAADDEEGREAASGYDLVAGVAVIPVCGTLVQRLGTLRPFSGMTGYDGIRQNFLAALADGKAGAIMLDIDSPGGEVAGCFDLADTIWRARGSKPVWAVVNEMACSAAYALASATDRITVPRTGVVGSVGVIALHVDLSKALEEAGITVTLIQYGARKSDGSEVIPLAPEARNRFQTDIDAVGKLFVNTVARNRKLDAAKVQVTEAGTFLGAAGVAAGFADGVMAPDEAFRALARTI